MSDYDIVETFIERDGDTPEEATERLAEMRYRVFVENEDIDDVLLEADLELDYADDFFDQFEFIAK